MEKMTPLFEYAEPEPKDVMRINDIVRKANGVETKEIMLATNMAKSIKDSSKMERRYYAAVEVLGTEHPVTEAFRSGLERFNIVPDDFSSNSTLKKEGFVLVTKKQRNEQYRNLKKRGGKYLVLDWSNYKPYDKSEESYLYNISLQSNLTKILIDLDLNTIIDDNGKVIKYSTTKEDLYLNVKVRDELSTRVIMKDGTTLYESGKVYTNKWEYVPGYVPGEEDGDYFYLELKNGIIQNI